ncbi:MAG: hypothetical protein WBF43_04345, partial [Methylocella sp.]
SGRGNLSPDSPDFMLDFLGAWNVRVMSFGESIVPAAVPNRRLARVFLKGVGELRAGQSLNVNIAVLVSIGVQLRLRIGT